MTLKKYRQKRSFEQTPEPKGALNLNVPKSSSNLSGKTFHLPIFCIQKHAASHLHYDFRLEHRGALLSWAVPKGPSLRPTDKRLAIQVEDHPFEYRNFEGTIPKGNYGAGTVMIWDEGSYYISENESKKSIETAIDAGLKKGHLQFFLIGKKLQGAFSLVKMKNSENNWLLIKSNDNYAKDIDIETWDDSVRTARTMKSIEQSLETKKKSIIKKLPAFTPPMLATLKESAFDDAEWLFEIKWDGYRALAYVGSNTLLYSRNQTLFNTYFKPIVDELDKIKQPCILDGEIVILDANGKSDFQLMQKYQKTQQGTLCYYVYDLLFLDGKDMRDCALLERKEQLRALLQDYSFKLIRFSDHIEEKGISFYKKAQKYHLEGIIAKNKASVYRSIRSKEWLKIKTHYRQEVVIGGFTQPRGSRKYFGALLLGVYEKNQFVYIGHVGTGFRATLLKDIYEKMTPLLVTKCPFNKMLNPNMPASWIKPQLVCEVAFAEWTDQGMLRQGSFKGLRSDKKAKEVKRELLNED